MAWFRSNEERAALLGRETGCTLWQGDVGDESEVEEIFERFDFAGIVHLAGWNRNALVLQTSPPLWGEVVRSHLDSSFLMCRAALAHLPRGGQLLLVSSRVGLIGNGGQSAYGAAKAGVFGLMKTAALEGRERGIHVNALCPGFASGASGVLAKRELLRRESEDLVPDSDTAQSFAAFTSWFLSSNSKVSGQILRPDCRI
ncbi:3-oxoacyl-[acyl-carrier-protein] reductase FabG [Abditibacteriota bacterium]|nr:3-oxoacyl-[acyl-carrier-protein] reductase FabG [Abditibacteriota bacterium]